VKTSETVFIAADHAGFDFKERLKKMRPDINWNDLGTYDASRVDYPDFADRLCLKMIEAEKRTGGPQPRGVLVCGSGQGMAMRANRYSEIRAALVWNEESARLSREHNDANVICLGARLVDPVLALELFDLFIKTRFAGGRHADRVNKLSRSC
jgi:ribose 5-phosphate isomerase B